MRTRTKQLLRSALVSLSLAAAAIIAPRDARAETDLFGTGNGHNGAHVAAAADEVINAYAPLTADAAVGNMSVTIGTAIGAPTGFAIGDLVMLWRATGLVSTDPAATSGNQAAVDLVLAGGGAIGRFELARVAGVTATTLTFTKPLTQAFAQGVTQVVTVPEYTTVSVPAATSITASAWQTAGTGFAGGIVAFLSTGAVTLDGRIHADARGFRGGRADQSFETVLMTCAGNDGTEATGFAAKGEGIVATEFGGATHGGRGNRANGAGGGNCTENGGGGGGHAGVGGVGGDAILTSNKGGLGGAKTDYSLLTRLGMGGGGGAGEQKNGVGSGGGAGGGVVFARVKSIAGATTGEITANGQAAANAGILGVESDGAGGGGAGGSILIRAVENVTCSSAATKGGGGGSTAVIGLGTFGPGGGGAGGRVLIQAKDATGCPITVAAGTAGVAGVGNGRGAAAGAAGETQAPAPGGTFCFSNPTTGTEAQCANPTPVCDPATGFCFGCSGPFGGGTARACTVAVKPVCAPNGGCNPCDGDNASGTAFACQLPGAPYCFLTGPTVGSCGKCTADTDCGAGHGGTACNEVTGNCGAPCTMDTDCKATEWCAGTPGVCTPKTANGAHVPMESPINGDCTPVNGTRTCLSAVCEPDDDLCGLKNGSPCQGGAEKCRSTICFPADQLCGKPAGEPCMMAGECRSDVCTAGICTGCTDDTNCGVGKVCDKDRKECVNGCREVGGKSNCIAPKQCSAHDGTIGLCVDVPDAGNGSDAGFVSDTGILEGGGCACRTSVPISGSPLALAAAAVGALLVARRRRERSKNDTKDQA